MRKEKRFRLLGIIECEGCITGEKGDIEKMYEELLRGEYILNFRRFRGQLSWKLTAKGRVEIGRTSMRPNNERA